MDEEMKIETSKDIKSLGSYITKIIFVGVILIIGMFFIWVGIMNIWENGNVFLSIIILVVGLIIFFIIYKDLKK